MNKRTTLILYLTILLSAIIFFMHFLFPEDKVNQHIRYMFQNMLPDYDIHIKTSRPSFPVALTLSEVSVFKLTDEVFGAQTVKIGRPVSSFFSSNPSFSIKAKAYGGKIDGTVTTKETESVEDVSTDFRLSEVQIGDIPLLYQSLNVDVSGVLNGTVTYDGINKPDSGAINLYLTDVTMPMTISSLNFGDISFTDVTIEGKINQQDLAIANFDAKGKQASIQLSGIIVLKNPVDDSLLNLSGAIEPYQELLKNIPINLFVRDQKGNKGLPLNVSGTFKNPVFSFR